MNPMNIRRSVVVLSGGLDSTTCALMANALTSVAAVVHFDYGQRHGVERECFDYWAKRLAVPAYVIPVPSLELVGASALTAGPLALDPNERHPQNATLPASFVPGRNLVFLTLAAALAEKLGASEVWTGVCGNDHAGYPDCRPDTMEALQLAIRRGMGTDGIKLITPFIHQDKGSIWKAAEATGHLAEIIEHTHTCYRGERKRRLPWGYGCSRCMACDERRAGFNAHFGDRR
jgi:7-cyano-7-deazaguanine synthase